MQVFPNSSKPDWRLLFQGKVKNRHPFHPVPRQVHRNCLSLPGQTSPAGQEFIYSCPACRATVSVIRGVMTCLSDMAQTDILKKNPRTFNWHYAQALIAYAYLSAEVRDFFQKRQVLHPELTELHVQKEFCTVHKKQVSKIGQKAEKLPCGNKISTKVQYTRSIL